MAKIDKTEARGVLGHAKRTGEALVDFDSKEEADAFVDILYGLSDEIACAGEQQKERYRLKVVYL